MNLLDLLANLDWTAIISAILALLAGTFGGPVVVDKLRKGKAGDPLDTGFKALRSMDEAYAASNVDPDERRRLWQEGVARLFLPNKPK